VYRASRLDGRTDLNLFDMHSPAIAYLVLAFAQFGALGG